MSYIAYIDKTSLVDWDGKITATIFLYGCNFRCRYCYNKDLLRTQVGNISIDDVIRFLSSRMEWLDGVVITGGEPTIHPDSLINLCEKIKDLGYKIKLDTNGSNPKVLWSLIDENLIDYVAMDIKWYFDRYHEVVGVRIDPRDLERSVCLLKSTGIGYEFRTTVLRSMDFYDIINIAKQVAPAKKYVLQAQVEDGKIVVDRNTIIEASKYLNRSGWFDEVKIRNSKLTR